MIPLVNKNASKRTTQGFKACVAKIGCEPEAVEAVIAVEAAGRGWDRHGRRAPWRIRVGLPVAFIIIVARVLYVVWKSR